MEVDEHLLSAPGSTAGIENFQKPLSRTRCSYKNTCEVFRDNQQAKKEYTRQYSHIYFSRLMGMSKLVEQKAKKKVGRECKQLSELSKWKGQECVVIGTIFKQMDLKPSILKEISAKNHLAPPPPRSRYVSSTDKLILEDQMQRVVLKWEESGAGSGESLPGSLEEELVTGVVVGVWGREIEKGEFLVKDVCFGGPLPVAVKEEEEEEEMEEQLNEDRYVLFVSGWNLGSSSCDQLSIEMMVDYVTGQLGGARDNDLCSSIVQVVLAGNSVTDKPVKSSLTKTTQSRFLTRNYSAECLEAVKELDNLLYQLSSCVPVDLMPGSHDPTNFQLPQQPMHKCMFPKSGQQKNLMGVTNPYSARIGGRSFIGTSGENILDIRRFTVVTDSLRILENTLHWGHLAPTAPDTLACYPYASNDPFILQHTPDVYFAGNQPKFQKKIIKVEGRSVLMVCIPEFEKSRSCVLVNLANLDCREVKFSTSMSATPSSKPGGGVRGEGGTEEEGEDSDVYVPVEENMSILNHMDDQDDFDD